MPTLHLTGGLEADALLSTDPNALLLAMVLDQQVPMEKAFSGPSVIAQRLGGRLDVDVIAGMDPDRFAELCAQRPAVHRFPKAMAGRIQAVCRVLVERYEGDAANLWADVSGGAELRRRIADLPGFGPGKSQIFVALLGKQYGVTPHGWREAAGDFGAAGSFLSVADIVDAQSLRRVRDAKKEAKKDAKETGRQTARASAKGAAARRA